MLTANDLTRAVGFCIMAGTVQIPSDVPPPQLLFRDGTLRATQTTADQIVLSPWGLEFADHRSECVLGKLPPF